MKIRKINDKSARKEITSYIIKQKNRGISKVDAWEIYDTVKLPPEQIDKVMTKFEEEGKVIEI